MEQEKIMVALEKHTEINAAYIFGSVAKGTAKPDIAVQAHRPLTTEQHIALVEVELGHSVCCYF